ncbi:hypothetical protein BD769DRAFT_1385770 [Suillus cothurnatus]|nr:hypothetical protein BD769DRAFT_1385770 [Suillus cothurnatus]
MTSSQATIQELAVQLCDVIAEARAISAGADTMTQAKQAGRIVTESIKLAPEVKAIPPILLSCAMALWNCAKQVENKPIVHNKPNLEIVRVPDWGAIGYDDRRIMRHPLHKKAMIWMSSVGEANDAVAMKVCGNGIDWQAILCGRNDQREVLEQYENGVEGSMSRPSLKEVPVEVPEIIQVFKPRMFVPVKRKAADKKGEGIEREQEDAEPRKGKDHGAVMTNTQQHLFHGRSRKRKRMNPVFEKYAESSDDDFQMDELMEGPSNNVIGMSDISRTSMATEVREGNINCTQNAFRDGVNRSCQDITLFSFPSCADETQVTEVVRKDECTPCSERSLKCIFGYSKKTGKRLNSCEECTRKKARCFYGREPETVTRGQSRARFCAKSRVRSKTRPKSPTAPGPTLRAAFTSPSQNHRSIIDSSRVVTPDIQLSSVQHIPASECAAMNSMEARLVMLEAGLARLNTVIGKLGEESDTLRQKVVPQHPTVLPAQCPSLPPAQMPMPSPITHASIPSLMATLTLQTDATRLSGADDESMGLDIS